MSTHQLNSAKLCLSSGHLRAALRFLMTTTVVAIPAVAFAHSQATTETPPAAPVAANPSGLEDIIVTAQRRNENLQAVPLTVKALTATNLAEKNITTALDIGKLVPAVNVAQSSGTVQIFIRGIGNSVDSQGNEPSNALYVDGVYYSRLVSSLFRFNNIERIEVLKGPQGTLFGRNAEGGLIQIVTKTPSPGDAPSGEISAGYGSFNTYQGSAYLSSGLGDKFAADIAASYYNNRGFGDNVFTGGRANYERSFAVRSKLVFAPAEGTKITLAGDYSKGNTDIGIPGQKPGSPVAGAANTGFPDGSGLLPRIGYYDANLNTKRNYYAEQYGGSLKIEQDVGFGRLLSISAYHKNNEFYDLDNDFGPQFEAFTKLPSNNEQFTQELQLQSKAGSSFDWTIGGFYLDIKQGYNNAIIFGRRFSPPPGSNLLINSAAPLKSYAVYGQTTFALAPKLKLTLGARYSDDKIKGNGQVDIQLASGGIIRAVPFSQAETSEDRLTGKGVLSYQATDDVLAYASVSRGYKSGLYNILTFSPTFVKAEVLDAFEVGVKSELFDSKVRLNAAAFYNKFKNPQVQIVSAASLLFLVNAKRARTYGAEIDAEIVPVENLSIQLSGSYLNAKYTDFDAAPFYTPNPAAPFGVLPPVPGDAAGNSIPKSPKFAGNIGFLYKIPVDDGRWLLSSNFAYTSSFFWTPENRDKQEAYGLLDARIAYEFQNGFSVSVWGSNLTDKKYQIQAQTQVGFGGDLGAPGAPRQYGVSAAFKF